MELVTANEAEALFDILEAIRERYKYETIQQFIQFPNPWAFFIKNKRLKIWFLEQFTSSNQGFLNM